MREMRKSGIAATDRLGRGAAQAETGTARNLVGPESNLTSIFQALREARQPISNTF